MIDSHAHYDDERFEGDRDEVIEYVHQNGVELIINAASDVKSSLAAISLAEKYDYVYALVGIHPHEAAKASPDSLDEIKRMTENKKVVAIGEIGLDYHYDFSPRQTQIEWFSKQMELAAELKMPVAIHSREATEDTMKVLRAYPDVKGVVHSFSGSTETLKELVKMGYCISLGGVVTFKNAKAPLETARECPKDRLLLETDCPYLTPEPHRGKRNDSSYMIYTARKIAELRGEDLDMLCKNCAENTYRVFGIKNDKRKEK